VFENVEKVKVFIVENLSINYELEYVSVEVDESFYISKNKIFICKDDLENNESLIIDIIVRILGNNPTVTDIIHIVINSSDQKSLNDYFNRFEIPFPNEDVVSFAKNKKKRLKQEEIIDAEEFLDEDDNETESDEDLKSSTPKGKSGRGSKKPDDTIIPVTVKPWSPESDPDLEVEISDTVISKGNGEFGQSSRSESVSGRSGGFYPRYDFSSDNSYEKEIGDWGEKFVFNNLAKELISQNVGKKFTLDKEKQNLTIYSSEGDSIISLANRNVSGLTQSGYDFLLEKEGENYFIEVKTTTRNGLTKFKIEETQWDCCRNNKEYFILIIVRNAGTTVAAIERIPNLFKLYEEGLVSIRPERMSLII